MTKNKYLNISAEIARSGLSKKIIAKRIGITERALFNKLVGKTNFLVKEALILNDIFILHNPKSTVEYLFKNKEV